MHCANPCAKEKIILIISYDRLTSVSTTDAVTARVFVQLIPRRARQLDDSAEPHTQFCAIVSELSFARTGCSHHAPRSGYQPIRVDTFAPMKRLF